MVKSSKTQARKAVATEKILDAAIAIISKRGESDLTIKEVVRLSGVPRATVYHYFKNRENIIKAFSERFSEQFYDSVLRGSVLISDSRPDSMNIIDLTTRFANFVMSNPELSRIWLFELLTSPNPANDPIWKRYDASFSAFFKSGLAKDNIDAEVMTMLVLSCGVLWPVWTRAHRKSKAERRKLSERFTKTILRLSMWGSLRSEYFPEVAAFVSQEDCEDV